MPIKLLLAVFTLIICTAQASAEMYQWVDANGVVTFKDAPPPRKAKKRSKVTVYNDGDFAPAPQPAPASASPTRKTSASIEQPKSVAASKAQRYTGTVEIYLTDWCRYCRQAKEYMNSKGIPYVAYNIDKDKAAKKRHAELGGNGVPLIIIGSNKMSGFSPEALEYYLDHTK